MREIISEMPQSRSRYILNIVWESEDEVKNESHQSEMTENGKVNDSLPVEDQCTASQDNYEKLKAEVIGLLQQQLK